MKKLLYSLAAVLAIAACTPDSASDSGDNNDNPQENSEGNSQENQDDNTQDNPKYKAPQLVDLGLPSGVKWAASDLGSEDPAVPGDYFSWGETETTGYFGNTNKYWEYEDGIGYATKYSVSLRHGRVLDMKTVLEPEDDAASVALGEGWRTPSFYDICELLEYCDVDMEFVGEEPNVQEIYTLTSTINGNKLTMAYDVDHPHMCSSIVCNDMRDCVNNNAYVLMGSAVMGGNFRTLGLKVRPVYGGSAKEFEWKVRAEAEPEVGSTTAIIGGAFLFEEDVMKEYKYYVGLFNSVRGDSFTFRKDITRTTKAQFSGLEPGHTYYYAVCCQVKWRQDGYTMTEDYISEVRSFTTGN